MTLDAALETADHLSLVMPNRSIVLGALALVVASCTSDLRAPQRDGASTLAARASKLAALGVHAEAPSRALTFGATADARFAFAEPEASFALVGAASVAGHTRAGITLFPGALDGADVVRVTKANGVEDFVFYEEAPSQEEIAYDLDVSHIAGLRLVGGGLELLDSDGAPRLRVERPFVIGADGARVAATLGLSSCFADTNPAAPWHRPVVAPGAASCRVSVSWHGAAYPAVLDPVWTYAESLTGAGVYAQAMIELASGQLLVLDGFSDGGTTGSGVTKEGELFDPATSTWAMTSAPLENNGRENFAMAPLPNGNVLIAGGGANAYETYDPTTGNFNATAQASQPLGVTATALQSGLVLVVGGAVGGMSLGASSLYDGSNDTVTPSGDLGAARTFHTATLLASGDVLVIGGDGPSGALSSAELYDPTAGTFAPTGSMAAARANHVAALLGDGTVLVAGGGSATAEIYDPTAGTFSPTGSMSTDRQSATATVLETGHVMVAGGVAPAGTQATVEVYDPTTRTFVPASTMSVPRSKATAALLTSGKVLVAGGRLDGGDSTPSVEEWAPDAAGTACAVGDDCLAGVCIDGICCSGPCSGACKTCQAGTGACIAITSAPDPDNCSGTSACDANGVCRLVDGQTCSAATGCVSGFCVDGVCCDSQCTGECQACDVAARPGVCSPTVGQPHGSRTACTAFGTMCGGACNGIDLDVCVFPNAALSCGSTCTAGQLGQGTCDGQGTCVAAAPEPCAGNFACADGATCKTTCTADTDCATGYHCDSSKCTPDALCNDHILTVGSMTTDCSPYTCEESGTCRTSCSSTSDCAAPNVCAADGKCIAPAATSSGSSGCSTGGGGSNGWVPLGIALLAACGRRRRRA